MANCDCVERIAAILNEHVQHAVVERLPAPPMLLPTLVLEDRRHRRITVESIIRFKIVVKGPAGSIA